MKNTNTKEFKAKVDAYLLDAYRSKAEDYENGAKTDPELIRFILDTFKKEYGHEIRRQGSIQGALASWLSGLALNIDYTNSSIIKRAEEWHECELTEKQADIVCEKWFDFMACKIMQLAGRHGLHV